MFWGCFSSVGTGPLVRVGGTIDSSKYQSALAQNLVPTRKLKMGNFTFQHSNRKQISKSTNEWVKQNLSARMAQSEPRPESIQKSVVWSEEGCAQEMSI